MMFYVLISLMCFAPDNTTTTLTSGLLNKMNCHVQVQNTFADENQCRSRLKGSLYCLPVRIVDEKK